MSEGILSGPHWKASFLSPVRWHQTKRKPLDIRPRETTEANFGRAVTICKKYVNIARKCLGMTSFYGGVLPWEAGKFPHLLVARLSESAQNVQTWASSTASSEHHQQHQHQHRDCHCHTSSSWTWSQSPSQSGSISEQHMTRIKTGSDHENHCHISWLIHSNYDGNPKCRMDVMRGWNVLNYQCQGPSGACLGKKIC